MTRERTGENKICVACGKDYYVSLWRLKRSNSSFCSVYCQNHKQYENKRNIHECIQCKKSYEDSPSRKLRKYCSRECLELNTKSRREYAKKSAANRRLTIGSNISSKALRGFVWTIKDKICEICDYNEYDFILDIHHIDEDPSNNSIENLAVLCCICHKKLHRGVILDERYLKRKE